MAESKTEHMSDVQALKEDVIQLKNDVKSLVQALTNDGRQKMDDARHRVWDAARGLENQAEEQLRSTCDTAPSRVGLCGTLPGFAVDYGSPSDRASLSMVLAGRG
ncbi:hypothetical protein HQ520_03075 [bacterium]|nr:hypothetical protein [bacterium]